MKNFRNIRNLFFHRQVLLFYLNTLNSHTSYCSQICCQPACSKPRRKPSISETNPWIPNTLPTTSLQLQLPEPLRLSSKIMLSCKRNLVPSLYLSLLDINLRRSSLATPSKPLFFSCNTFFHQLLTTPYPKMFLPVITPFFVEGRCFSESVLHSRHIENDPQCLVYIVTKLNSYHHIQPPTSPVNWKF